MIKPQTTPMGRLSPSQRQLVAQIDELAEIIRMDHWNVGSIKGHKTEFLQLILRRMVNAEIITRYTLIDEYLSVIICDYYFPRRKGEKSYQRLWRSEKFKIFNHFLMDEIFILTKMNIVKAISPLPRDIEPIINRVNALRNTIAHSLFPENRRKNLGTSRVLYDGTDIYSIDGVRKFKVDCGKVCQCLETRVAT